MTTETDKVLSEIENEWLRFRGRARGPDETYSETALLWRALEAIGEVGTPEFWAPVHSKQGDAILIVVNGAATLTLVSEDGATTRHVGSLKDGLYDERVVVREGETYGFEAEFRHDRLPSPLTIEAKRWRELPRLQSVRDQFRAWAEGRDASDEGRGSWVAA